MPGEFSPYLVATPLVTLMFAFYGRVMPFGALGYVGGALAGFVWSLVAGVVSSWLSHDATIAALSADAVLFACVIVAGSLVGGGVLSTAPETNFRKVHVHLLALTCEIHGICYTTRYTCLV